MKAGKRYIHIRTKLLALAIIPVILVSSILGYYLIKTRINDVHASLINKGELIVKNFSPTIEFGLFTHNLELLELLSQPILRDAEVISVAMYDKDENLILTVFSQNNISTSAERLFDDISTFRSPVISTRLLPDGVEVLDEDKNAEQIMGAVEISLSHHVLNQRQKEIIETSIFLLAGVLLACVFIAIRIGMRVSAPILSLTTMVESIGRGDLNARTDENASGELGYLQIGINAMAETIKASHGRMKDEIEVSTIALRHTVKALEEKNTELESAKSELEKAVLVKSEFLAKMSHEIRTPLNAVIGFTQLIEKSNNKHDLNEYTRTIKHAGSQLLTVIDDILSFSKLEKADVQFQHVPFDLRNCLEDMLSMFSPLAKEKKLPLTLLIGLDVPGTLISDPLRINQVLSNLINNALKFTERGAVTIKVFLVESENRQAIVRFSVNDTGIGIEAEKESLLFRAFSQLDANISRQYEGVGLGLAISKRIVELMGGRIGVDSTHKKGSSFWFEIPCKLGCETNVIPEYSLSGCSALLFDLHPTSRLAIRNYFLSWQVNLYVAKNSGELRERLADETLTFDFVVISLGYDNASNSSVAEVLNDVEQHYNNKIFILTSSNYHNLFDIYAVRENVTVLEKPIRKHKLYERIINFFDISPIIEHNDENQVSKIDKEAVEKLPILVVEDNEFNAILISAMLEERGYQVTCCSSGKEILSLLPETKFVLFFIDIHMPDMDGYELALKCRREKLISDDVPLIAFTADIMLRKIDSLSDCGFNDVLYKPISNESLDRLLVKWVVSGQVIRRNPSFANILDSKEMRQRLFDDLNDKISCIKTHSGSLNSSEVHEQLHQLEGLLGYYQLTRLLAILKEIKSTILEGDRDSTLVKLEQLETEILQLRREKEVLNEL